MGGSLERADHGFYIESEAIKHGHNWAHAAEAYISGKAYIEVHIGVRSGRHNEYEHYWVVRLRVSPWRNRFPVEQAVNQLRSAVDVGIGPIGGRRLVGGHNEEMEPPVLVYIGQADQLRKRMELPPLGSLVWLVRLEPCDVVGVDILKEPVATEVLDASNYWELDNFGFAFSGDASEVLLRELPHQVIQGGSEVVNCIPDYQWPRLVDLYDAIQAVDDGPLVRFVLPPKGDDIRIWGSGLRDLGAKQVDMASRMGKLRSTSRHIKSHRSPISPGAKP